MTNRFTTKQVLKKVKFVGEDVDIAKLTVSQVLAIQELAKEIKEGDEQANLTLLLKVITFGVPELKDFEREDFLELPMDELSKLSNEVMKHSGLSK